MNLDVNESDVHFVINKTGDIRFGFGGMKGFGNNIAEAIINERKKNGAFADVYDFVEIGRAHV